MIYDLEKKTFRIGAATPENMARLLPIELEPDALHLGIDARESRADLLREFHEGDLHVPEDPDVGDLCTLCHDGR